MVRLFILISSFLFSSWFWFCHQVHCRLCWVWSIVEWIHCVWYCYCTSVLIVWLWKWNRMIFVHHHLECWKTIHHFPNNLGTPLKWADSLLSTCSSESSSYSSLFVKINTRIVVSAVESKTLLECTHLNCNSGYSFLILTVIILIYLYKLFLHSQFNEFIFISMLHF